MEQLARLLCNLVPALNRFQDVGVKPISETDELR
jgi:hypothetical protein